MSQRRRARSGSDTANRNWEFVHSYYRHFSGLLGGKGDVVVDRNESTIPHGCLDIVVAPHRQQASGDISEIKIFSEIDEVIEH